MDSGADTSGLQKACVPPGAVIIPNSDILCGCSSKFQINNYGSTLLDFKIGNKMYRHRVRIVDDIDSPIVLGMDFMLANDVIIDAKNKQILFGENCVVKMDERYVAKVLNKRETKLII